MQKGKNGQKRKLKKKGERAQSKGSIIPKKNLYPAEKKLKKERDLRSKKHKGGGRKQTFQVSREAQPAKRVCAASEGKIEGVARRKINWGRDKD